MIYFQYWFGSGTRMQIAANDSLDSRIIFRKQIETLNSDGKNHTKRTTIQSLKKNILRRKINLYVIWHAYDPPCYTKIMELNVNILQVYMLYFFGTFFASLFYLIQ